MSAATQEPKVQLATVERTLDIENIAEQVEARRVAEVAAREAANGEVEAVEAVETPVVEPGIEDQVTKQMRKVKVDGEELEVSEDDLVASYQKQAAATRRLQHANEEAARIVAEAKAEAEKIKTPVAAEERATKVQQYHEALVSGDMEAANKLFDEIGQGRQQPIPDVNQIIEQVTPVVQQKLSNESALAKFETDFKDIIADPYLVSVTKANLEALMAEGKPYAEALPAAGKATQDWLKSKIPDVPTEQPTTTRAEKLGKKDAITQIPSANLKAASTAERELTPSEIIAEERKRRGLE